MSVKVSPQVAIATIICPRCKLSQLEQLVEIWEGQHLTFEIPGPGKRYRDGWLGEGAPAKVKAKCACGHKWMLRGIKQITDLDIPSTKKRKGTP